MKIRTLSQLQNALDAEIAWRVKEIADLKLAAKKNDGLSEKTLIRAGIAILYAHWEGFVKSAATIYINFVDNQGKTYGDLQTCFAVLGIRKQLTELVKAKKFRIRIAAVDFIRESSATRSQLQKFAVDTESNLKAEVFENIALSIGISIQPYESRFKLMDESLLRRRNKIAHGDYLDLDADAWRKLADEVISLMRDFKTDIENAASTSAFVR
jgi:MAE_28990/MAE_18760-like HEPN